jgi:hypothetical protein
MMKKLLVLTLVLGIASLASAGTDLGDVSGLSYSVSGQEVTISGTGVIGFIFNLEAAASDVISDVAVNSTAFASQNNNGAWYSSYGGVHAGISGAATSAQTGTIVTFDVKSGTTEVDVIYHWAGSPFVNFGGDDVDLTGYTISLVPEPATMALLGLGGLFLARRKK